MDASPYYYAYTRELPSGAEHAEVGFVTPRTPPAPMRQAWDLSHGDSVAWRIQKWSYYLERKGIFSPKRCNYVEMSAQDLRICKKICNFAAHLNINISDHETIVFIFVHKY